MGKRKSKTDIESTNKFNQTLDDLNKLFSIKLFNNEKLDSLLHTLLNKNKLLSEKLAEYEFYKDKWSVGVGEHTIETYKAVYNLYRIKGFFEDSVYVDMAVKYRKLTPAAQKLKTNSIQTKIENEIKSMDKLILFCEEYLKVAIHTIGTPFAVALDREIKKYQKFSMTMLRKYKSDKSECKRRAVELRYVAKTVKINNFTWLYNEILQGIIFADKPKKELMSYSGLDRWIKDNQNTVDEIENNISNNQDEINFYLDLIKKARTI